MLLRIALVSVLSVGIILPAWGQTPGRIPPEPNGAWRASGEVIPASADSAAERADSVAEGSRPAASPGATSGSPADPLVLVAGSASTSSKKSATPGNVTLPSGAGQVWREYDISKYTTRVTSTRCPQQAIIDWILRETGYEAWHSEPLGVLTANRRTLRVYHTPQMQTLVGGIVDRFLSSEAATYTFSMRVVTLDSPSWRSQAQPYLQPVAVQTPGVSAWILAKENAAMLLGQLRRRNDYREHSSPYLMVNNGQSAVVSAMRARPYARDVISRPELPAGFEIQPGRVEEGYNIDFSPLLSADRRLIDATIKCEIDQVEKIIPVVIDVPSTVGAQKEAKIETPQMAHYRFHERFRWPTEHVLVVGLGVVPLPLPVDSKPMVPGVPLPFGQKAARGDLLIFVQCKGQVAEGAGARTPERNAQRYRGRY